MNSIWVSQHGLTEFDPSVDYSEGLWQERAGQWTSDEEHRRQAFTVDAMQFHDHVYWANYLKSETEAGKRQRWGKSPSKKADA